MESEIIQPVKHQELFQKFFYNENNHIIKKNMDGFCFEGKPVMCYCQIDTFRCQRRSTERKGEHW